MPRLRPLQADDAPALLELLGDERVTRYHSMPTLSSLAEARDALARVDQRFHAGEMIRWALDRPTGHGKADLSRERRPPACKAAGN